MLSHITFRHLDTLSLLDIYCHINVYLNYRDKSLSNNKYLFKLVSIHKIYTTHTPTCSIVSSDPTQCVVSPRRRQWVSSSGSCEEVSSALSGLDGLSVLSGLDGLSVLVPLWPGTGPGWHPPHRPETRRVRDLSVQQVSVTSSAASKSIR